MALAIFGLGVAFLGLLAFGFISAFVVKFLKVLVNFALRLISAP